MHTKSSHNGPQVLSSITLSSGPPLKVSGPPLKGSSPAMASGGIGKILCPVENYGKSMGECSVCSSPHSYISVRLQPLLTQVGQVWDKALLFSSLWYTVGNVSQVQCLPCFLFFTSKIFLISNLEISLTTGLCCNDIQAMQSSSAGWHCHSKHPLMPLSRIWYFRSLFISYNSITLSSPVQTMVLHFPLRTEMENGVRGLGKKAHQYFH